MERVQKKLVWNSFLNFKLLLIANIIVIIFLFENVEKSICSELDVDSIINEFEM